MRDERKPELKPNGTSWPYYKRDEERDVVQTISVSSFKALAQ